MKSRVFPIDFESRNSLEPRGSLYIPTQRGMDLRAISPLLFPSVFLIRDLPRRLSNAAIITRQFVEARIVYSKLSKLLVNEENTE